MLGITFFKLNIVNIAQTICRWYLFLQDFHRFVPQLLLQLGAFLAKDEIRGPSG